MTIPHYYLIPPLPEGLEGLAEMALDLRWSWSHASDALWQRIEPDLWDLTRNPWLILQTVSFARLQALAADPTFRSELTKRLEEHREAIKKSCWFPQNYPDSPITVAYFSMEFGLSEALPIYSGGLGILAGDYLKTASDLGVPVIGIGLLYQQGYFRQVIDADGAQMEFYSYNDPGQLPLMPVRDEEGEWLRMKLDFPGRRVRFRVWQAKVGRVTLYLLDSNDPANSPADQSICTELYGGGQEMRLQQEIALGVGGWQLLRTLGVRAEICHLNEGHAALAVIERARSFMDDTGQPFDVALAATRAGNVFTTHTPVAAGFDCFSPALVRQYLGPYAEQLGIGLPGLMALGREDPDNEDEPLNMAYLAIRGVSTVNGVSRLHGRVSRAIFQRLFPHWPEGEVPVTHVTNGVHMPSWDSAAADALWQEAAGKTRWRGTMSTLEADLKQVSDAALWALRSKGCHQLIHYARARLTRQVEAAGASRKEIDAVQEYLDPTALTMGFARRFATYKRPNLLLHDPARLARLLLDTSRPVQLIIAGKAHPRDEAGKAMIRAWTAFIRRPEIRSHAIFLADYDMSLAEQLVQGVDLWINTPRRPWEASGTSGMKILVNGGLNLSELDGWWAEAFRPEVGWALGDGMEHDDDPAWDAWEAEQLYRLLEEEVIPAFFNRGRDGIPHEWVNRMRFSMAELTPQFSSNRMVREYVERLYHPAAKEFRARTADGARRAALLCNWRGSLIAHWQGIRFNHLDIREGEGRYIFEVQVALNGVDPGAVRIQLYADPLKGEEPEIHPMVQTTQAAAPDQVLTYSTRIKKVRPATDYTPRIIPYFEGATVPIEATPILWFR